MTEFKVHDEKSAPEASRSLLETARRKYSFVPNLMGVLAESPAALEAYMLVGGAFEKTSFSPVERQIVLLATSHQNRCHYCMAAHSMAAKMAGASDDLLEALREGRPLADARLEALRSFARQVVEKRGFVSEEDIDAFASAGYGKAQVLEVLVGVAQKTLSNYTNHIAHTPVDEAFRELVWTPPKEGVGA